MSQSARPTSLTSATWTGAYTDLADESDATYAQSPDGPVASQTFLCALSSIIDPGVDTGHQIRVRAVLEPSTGSPLDLVLAVENADDSSVVATRTYVAPGAYVDGVLTLTTAEAALIHSYAGLQVRGYAKASGGIDIDQATVQAAIDAASPGDTIWLKAGSATWTETIVATKAISIIGSGAGSTIITDGVANTSLPLVDWTTSGSSVHRLSGCTFVGHSTAKNPQVGMLRFRGAGSQVRIDHHAITSGNYACISINSSVRGVADHIDFSPQYFPGFPFYVFHESWGGTGSYGDNSWATSAALGTADAFYIEDCTGDGSDVPTYGLTAFSDGWSGPRTVIRHNVLTNLVIANHGTATSGRERGARSSEWYNNTLLFTGATVNWGSAMSINGGAGVVYNNAVTVTGGATVPNVINLSYPRSNDRGRTYDWWGPWAGETAITSITRSGSTATLTVSGGHGFGRGAIRVTGANQSEYNGTFAGTFVSATELTYTVTGTPTTPATGTMILTSPWDGNTDVYGYPAIDQPGRGTGDSVSGDYPAPAVWPNQALDPIYAWANTRNGSASAVATDSALVVHEDRDYYNVEKPGYSALTYPHPLAT